MNSAKSFLAGVHAAFPADQIYLYTWIGGRWVEVDVVADYKTESEFLRLICVRSGYWARLDISEPLIDQGCTPQIGDWLRRHFDQQHFCLKLPVTLG